MISVCIASYNGEKYIKAQLQSILKQLGDDDEIIISDDKSIDKTRSIIQSFCDSRISLIDGPQLGAMKNFENALLHSKGEYIFLSDQDDVWLDDKVSLMLANLERFDLVLSDCRVVDSNLNVINPSYFSVLRPRTGVVNNIIRNHYLGCCMAFKRSVLKYALPFPNNVIMHDIWIGLCADAFGKVGIINQPLMLYRRHDNTVSFAAGVSKNSLSFMVKYRFNVSRALLGRIINRKFIK